MQLLYRVLCIIHPLEKTSWKRSRFSPKTDAAIDGPKGETAPPTRWKESERIGRVASVLPIVAALYRTVSFSSSSLSLPLSLPATLPDYS